MTLPINTLITVVLFHTIYAANIEPIESLDDKQGRSVVEKSEIGSESGVNQMYVPYGSSGPVNSAPQYLASQYYVPNNYPSYNQAPGMDMRHEMSSLKETVNLLSNLVQQNLKSNQDREEKEKSKGYVATPNYEDPKDDYGQVSVNVYQKQHPYEKKTPPKEEPPPPPAPAPEPPGKKHLFHFEPKTEVIAKARATFELIKKGMRTALWTGFVVMLVRLAPLLWLGIRLIFNALLPLVGMTLLNKSDPPTEAISKAQTAIDSSVKYDSLLGDHYNHFTEFY